MNSITFLIDLLCFSSTINTNKETWKNNNNDNNKNHKNRKYIRRCQLKVWSSAMRAAEAVPTVTQLSDFFDILWRLLETKKRQKETRERSPIKINWARRNTSYSKFKKLEGKYRFSSSYGIKNVVGFSHKVTSDTIRRC